MMIGCIDNITTNYRQSIDKTVDYIGTFFICMAE